MRHIKLIINKVKSMISGKDYLDLLEERGFKHGKNFKMYDCNIDFGHCYLVEVGDDVILSNCTILAHDGSTKMYTGKSKVGKVKIGNRVFVGYNSIILCNVKIGDDVIVGAGSVVTKDIPNNSIIAGNPARVIGKTSDFIEKHKNMMNKSPIYSTYWQDKSREEINNMKIELEDTIGYDQ